MRKIFYAVTVSTFLFAFSIVTVMVPSAANAGANIAVVFETTQGKFTVLLYPDAAPKTVANFLKYVDEGFYEGTIFHRVIRSYEFGKPGTTLQNMVPFDMIQGGGYTLGMRLKRPTHPPVVSESSKALNNDKGTIAMARTNDPDSATSQFFINTMDNTMFNPRQTKDGMDPGYCAFGRVIRGMDVVMKMRQGRTTSFGPHENVPEKPVIIKKTYRIK